MNFKKLSYYTALISLVNQLLNSSLYNYSFAKYSKCRKDFYMRLIHFFIMSSR
jgi:hypothetical protein